jgi:hypothetical protein
VVRETLPGVVRQDGCRYRSSYGAWQGETNTGRGRICCRVGLCGLSVVFRGRRMHPTTDAVPENRLPSGASWSSCADPPVFTSRFPCSASGCRWAAPPLILLSLSLPVRFCASGGRKIYRASALACQGCTPCGRGPQPALDTRFSHGGEIASEAQQKPHRVSRSERREPSVERTESREGHGTGVVPGGPAQENS